MSGLVERLRAVDHMSVEDCFMQSSLLSQAADEIDRLRTALAAEYRRAIEDAAKVARECFHDPQAESDPGYVATAILALASAKDWEGADA